MAAKKEESMYIRLSPQDKALFTRAADREGMTFSEWVRWVLRKEARETEKMELGARA